MDYIRDTLYKHDTFQVFEVMIGSIFAGYLVADMNPKFLNEFNKFHYQLLVTFLIFNQKFNKTGIEFVSFYTLLFVLILRSVKVIINSVYDDEKNT